MTKKIKTTMVYVVYYVEIDYDGNIKSRSKKKEFDKKEEAQEYADKYNNKPKKKKYIDAIVIPTPKNIQVGTEVEVNVNKEWKLFGTISKITENFYYIDRADGKVVPYGTFFMQDSFMERIANEQLRVVIED